jgi:transcriptional regulator with XRE-family HTH domain
MNATNAQSPVWSEYDKFKEDYNRSVKHNKSFGDMITEIMTDKNITIEELIEKSTISKSTIERMRSGKIKTRHGVSEYIPFLNTIVAFCIACDVDMLMTITLLESLGLSFRRTDEVHYAYCYLIVNCRGESIDSCNNVLKGLKIKKEFHLCNRIV